MRMMKKLCSEKFRITRVILVFILGMLIISDCVPFEATRVIAIKTESVSEIHSSYCKAEANLIDAGDGSIEQHGFCWAETEDPDITGNCNQMGAITEAGTYSDFIEELSEETTYFVRAYVQTATEVYYGEHVSFKTTAIGEDNFAPVITSEPVEVAVVGIPYSYQLTAEDPDAGDEITYSIVTAPSEFSINAATGLFSGTPLSGSLGDNSIQLRATDLLGLFDEQSFTLTISEEGNSPPVITSDPETVAEVGSDYAYQLVAEDADAGDEITYSVISAPDGFSIHPTTGMFTGNPPLELFGNHSVKLRATDKIGLYDEQSFTLTVSAVGTLYDPRDGNTYSTMYIVDQRWMAENLRYLPAVSPASSGSYTEPHYYVYDYNGTNVSTAKAQASYTTYGALYNWPAAMAGSTSSDANPSGVQGVCPTGWHLPSDAEWKQLEMNLGMTQAQADADDERGTNEGSKLAGNESLWIDGLLDQNAEFGSSGINLLPDGGRDADANFTYQGNGVGLWSTSQFNSTYSWYRGLFYTGSRVYRTYYGKNRGYTVRCVKD